MLRNIQGKAQDREKKESKSAHKDRERGKTLLTFTRKQNHCILLQNPQGFVFRLSTTYLMTLHL